MRVLTLICLFLAASTSAHAQNHTTQAPITMEQLMQELRIQGGNWIFRFEQPIYAKITCTVSSFPDGKSSEVQTFVSDSPEKEIRLFFMASAMWIGDYPKPNQRNDKLMKVRLSNCKDTNGTRIIHYVDKFAEHPWVQDQGGRGEYAPCLPAVPELNREYVLHYYFKDGDPYEAKATICFLADPKDTDKVLKFDRSQVRDFKTAGEN